MIVCRKCGVEAIEPNQESYFHEHHLVPKFMFKGSSNERKQIADQYGRKNLCKKCHDILHLMIGKWLFDFVPENKKEDCRLYVKEKSLRWIGECER